MRRLFADTAPLQESAQFRALFQGQAGIDLGRQIATVTIPFQVFDLTRSSLMVGLVSLVQVVPLVVGSMVGGSIADAVDRRRMLLVIQIAMVGAGAGLLVNSVHPEPRLWAIFVLAAVIALFHGADSPARNSLVPRLVPARHVSAAFALKQLLRQTLHAVGPAVAGLLIAQAGVPVAYAVYIASFAVAATALRRLAPAPPTVGARRAGLRSIGEGLSYLRRRPILVTNFGVDLNAMVFAMPRALFPEFGTVLLGGTAATVGLLYAAPGAGALLGALTSGWVPSVRRQGRAVVVAVTAWGVAILAFSMTRSVWLAVFCLAMAGIADVVSSVFRTTILQLSIPDDVRGRLSGIHTSVVTGGPRLGDATSGGLASVLGPRLAVFSGGTACVLGMLLIARLVPQYWRYEAPLEDV